MSLKGVELQIALPKTFEAGKMADQAQQQTLAQQAHANEALKKEIERKQKAVNTSEGMAEISEEEEAGGEYIKGTRKKKKHPKEKLEKQAQHPFKGNFVDFSG
ncbi:RNA polymerase subunit sigma [Lysinibacillus sp. NPDC097279]|uniref:RNA polymerase subunit sigma n=1 Tax=Lysinibacillus sp. NPDC097279 TaxID=3364143 RepID=UPI003823A0D1